MIAVISWNTRDLLEECLRALAERAPAAEVAVVDNGSSDGSPELVRSRFPAVTLLQPERNLGFGPAVNLVGRQTEAPWLIAANADTALEAGALEQLLESAARRPDAGIIAPKLVLADGATQHSVHPFPTLAVGAAVALGLHQVSPRLGDRICIPGAWNPERARAVDWAHGAFLLIRREAFDAIGGFDERQWMYAEDLDIGWRMRRAGWSTIYEPSARVRHAVSASAKQAFADSELRQSRAAYAWMARRQGLPHARAYAALSLTGATARIALLALPARLAPKRYGAALARARRWRALHRVGLGNRHSLTEGFDDAPSPDGIRLPG